METTSSRLKDGCIVSSTTGLVLTFLAILLALGVGILVFFAKPGSHVTCDCVFLNATTTTAKNSSNVPGKDIQSEAETRKTYRLSSTLIPVLYSLEINPNIYEAAAENFTFEGYEEILFNCSKKTKNISINIHESITIANETLRVIDKSNCTNFHLYPTGYERDYETQIVIFFLNEELVPGCQYIISMSFSGPLKGDLTGLFYSSYEESGRTFYLAATLFSPIDARKAFPCFDEPAMKARFAITILRRRDFNSLSNMDIKSSQNRSDGFVADTFHTTPPMSTYLVAVVVSQFAHTTLLTSNGTKIRLWSQKSRLNETQFAIETAVKLLAFYEDFFGIPYMLPKLDLVAIPDYRVKGMENWGLVTLRDQWVLHNPRYSDDKSQMVIVQILAHEIAHLWCGDLVTPAWWSGLWLKEGFATYLEYYGIDHLYKDWKIWDRFVVIDLYQVFHTDSLGNSHAVEIPAEKPDHIRMLFNFISYSKGATLMRMMAYMFGKDVYRSALQKYLRANSYGSAKRFDLWGAMQQSLPSRLSNVNVTAIMEAWVLQKHYPVVTVTRTGDSLEITQQKFRADADLQNEKSVFGFRWNIPFSFTTSEERDFDQTRIIYLDPEEEKTVVKVDRLKPSNASWVIANLHQYGYYRVNYDDTNWEALIGQLNSDHTVIPIVNRAQIINDAWSLAKARRLDQRLAFRTLEYLNREKDYVPWITASAQLLGMDKVLMRTDLYSKFKKFARRSIQPLYRTFDWTNRNLSVSQRSLRSKIVELACHFDNEDCVDKARTYFTEWVNNNETSYFSIPAEIRAVIFKTGIEHGSDREWEYSYKKFKTATFVAERVGILKALSSSREIWALKRLLQNAIDPTQIRRQYATSTIMWISSNPIGRDLAWEFLNHRWKDLVDLFGFPSSELSQLLMRVPDSFGSTADYNKLLTFMMDHPELSTGSRALMQAVEKTLANIQWLTINLPIISDWLDDKISDQ